MYCLFFFSIVNDFVFIPEYGLIPVHVTLANGDNIVKGEYDLIYK